MGLGFNIQLFEDPVCPPTSCCSPQWWHNGVPFLSFMQGFPLSSATLQMNDESQKTFPTNTRSAGRAAGRSGDRPPGEEEVLTQDGSDRLRGGGDPSGIDC